jgi:intracellular septation protein A
MNWTHFGLAVLAAGIVSSITDWFFFGVLFHDKYLAHPEAWRRGPGSNETPAIIGSTLIGFVAAAAFMTACVVFQIHGYYAALELAGLVALMGALPITITNSFYIKMHSSIVFSHCLGWTTRLVVAALAAGWLLG